VKQGASGASSYRSGLADGLPNLAPRPCRQAGPPQPYSWCDYAALRTRPARLRSPVHTCTRWALVEEFFSTLIDRGWLALSDVLQESAADLGRTDRSCSGAELRNDPGWSSGSPVVTIEKIQSKKVCVRRRHQYLYLAETRRLPCQCGFTMN